ncbi:esterase [Actinoplanes lobatus]|uniref:Esterase n=1 Tax=Actinoplanes lobatus TaxID=113568 RepID=A0A7W7HKH0_9ACTN|nr:alpha/beta hydrolase [Actinoplanes lobatus]MBB4752186.1 acetyl esterase/lipase [Actinoplanes lobatus]GGN83892.1 esterase [Actinoplanes lobatus]GIE45447.1 esterase [Actinoplanes lobatus]
MTRPLKAAALNPQVRRVFRFVPNPPVRWAWMLRLMQSGSGFGSTPKMPAGMAHRFVRLGPGAGVHVYTPAGTRTRPALLWIHGGGMVVGSASQDHARCIKLAADLDIVVFSAEYRLAPRHPFPAPLDDCHTAWMWATGHAGELGTDPERIAVGGQSAGGGLAAGLAQRLRDEGRTQPVAQWLFCPMLDDRTAADRDLDRVRHYLWNNVSNRAGWSAYLATAPGSPDVPAYAAPARRADLAGLAPAWIGTGDIELFYDEDRRYAQALTAAGVSCVLDVIPGGPHAFESFLSRTPLARDYLARAERWLSDHLTPVR